MLTFDQWIESKPELHELSNEEQTEYYFEALEAYKEFFDRD